MNSLTHPTSNEAAYRKVMRPKPGNSHRYSAGTSALRCIGALLLGALATGLLLAAIDRHYTPIQLPAAPTIRSSKPAPGQGRVIVYECLQDAVLHKSMEPQSSTASSVFASQTGVQGIAPFTEAEYP